MVHVVSPRGAPASPAASTKSSSSINGSQGSKSHSSSEESLVDVAPVIDEVRDDIICAIFNLPASTIFYPDYSCALVATLAFQGRMYPANDSVCFYSNFLGKETKLVIAYETITELAKTTTMFSNAFCLKTAAREYTFTSFWGTNRDQCYDLLTSLRNKALGITMTTITAPPSVASPTSEVAPVATPPSPAAPAPTDPVPALDAPIPTMSSDPAPMNDIMKYTFPIPVETFVENFFTDEPIFGLVEFNRRKGATELKCDLWSEHPDDASLGTRVIECITRFDATTVGLTRTASFVLPVDAPIGPKSTRVHVTQIRRPLDHGGYLFDTSTKLADIPYSDCFLVEDRWILRKISETSCELCVQLRVVFLKSTMWRGIIESRAKSECKLKLLEWIEMANQAMSTDGLPPYPPGSRLPSPRKLPSPKRPVSPRRKASTKPKPAAIDVKPATTATTVATAVRRTVALKRNNIMPILFPWLVVIFLAVYVYRVHSTLSTMEATMESQQRVLEQLVQTLGQVQSSLGAKAMPIEIPDSVYGRPGTGIHASGITLQ
ncbi:hypothetical protein SDRG_02359 [Saprolegnia diclina VS20]|uniref:VASt domain-containing protein n=1 Tax=Saprolegnia diclina (strain VS20) TaxID=1156394 RepID=T0R2G1_SAPDV|nr:hypothetical protein SDRG_02359 [Saprolegnia diclina VS20]EQC40465.1 hypothetical protein SDRG_02359 [Saprolegnia diclina VS20]|eukprot:XP_008606164.1 hypothetical protein SDRG_02359 [Saprolegnia diclina VS20]